MKSLTKSSKPKLVSKDAQIQFSLPVTGVLRDDQQHQSLQASAAQI